MRIASSMAAASADAVNVPNELPLRAVAQSGRVTTAQLDLDVQGESPEENNKASSVSGVQMHGAARKVLPEHCTVTSAPPLCTGVRISASNLCARVMQAIALLQHVDRTMPDGAVATALLIFGIGTEHRFPIHIFVHWYRDFEFFSDLLRSLIKVVEASSGPCPEGQSGLQRCEVSDLWRRRKRLPQAPDEWKSARSQRTGTGALPQTRA
jgi:hypothetical protein